MSYKPSSEQPVLASSQRSAGDGYSNYINARSAQYALITIEVTAVSGSTQTLDVTLQCSPVNPAEDNTRWFNVYSETQITDFSSPPLKLLGHVQEDFAGFLRIAYTVGGTGTPTITFSASIITKYGG